MASRSFCAKNESDHIRRAVRTFENANCLTRIFHAVKVSSRRGEVVTTALVTGRVAEGVVFMPFHFADGHANVLTNPVLDDISNIPELKICACRVEKL